MSRVLGAILAGGASRRFGTDKALAEVGGVALLELARRAIAPACETVVVAGRDWPGLVRADDRPAPGLGPLGGLAGALDHATRHGFDAVLTIGCDMPEAPADLLALLAPAPAIVAGQPLLGLWQAQTAAALIAYLTAGEDRAIRAWAARCGARRIAIPTLPANINTPADLAAFTRPAGPRSSP